MSAEVVPAEVGTRVVEASAPGKETKTGSAEADVKAEEDVYMLLA